MSSILQNEELRMKNEENKQSAFECCASNTPEGARRFANANASQLGGFAAYAPAGEAESFMMGHKAFGFTCESRGLRSNPNS